MPMLGVICDDGYGLLVSSLFWRAQAVVRGWRDRRWVLHHITIPAILARGLQAKHALQTSRWVCAHCLEG